MALVDFSSSTTSTTTPMALCEVVEDHCESSTRRFRYNSITTVWARERTKDVQRNLDPKHPSFVKPSQVSGAFMLNLPRFCNEFLFKEDVIFTLVNENEVPFTVRFSGRKFSVRWKAFSNDNNLVERDALVFELVKPAKFQAYIIRAYGSSGVDGNLDEDDIEYQVQFTNKGFTAGWSRFSVAHNIGLGDALVFQLVTDSKFLVYIIRAYSPGNNESSISSMPSPFPISIEVEKYNAGFKVWQMGPGCIPMRSFLLLLMFARLKWALLQVQSLTALVCWADFGVVFDWGIWVFGGGLLDFDVVSERAA
ncbi:hypothetical protein GIB67_008956 [Kingdonia uniflora]|uniref:TF-B3 domain-containing protein n=1 Tax=Kingdonia uniflora TaxID=39325 RepID=A0A7J7LVW3_9MAGN|nr:hypothetical protein GIB67_008956 [Kingdonia uniflora]